MSSKVLWPHVITALVSIIVGGVAVQSALSNHYAKQGATALEINVLSDNINNLNKTIKEYDQRVSSIGTQVINNSALSKGNSDRIAALWSKLDSTYDKIEAKNNDVIKQMNVNAIALEGRLSRMESLIGSTK